MDEKDKYYICPICHCKGLYRVVTENPKTKELGTYLKCRNCGNMKEVPSYQFFAPNFSQFMKMR